MTEAVRTSHKGRNVNLLKSEFFFALWETFKTLPFDEKLQELSAEIDYLREVVNKQIEKIEQLN